ncbi:MAG: mevalonate kinase, partial [Methanobrevibacter sp.]|nr:mevalonate kinase [Methanobrevibacter sp.]
AHKIELSVQGMASPLDTAVSTFGGLVYLSREKEISKFNTDIKSNLVIGYTNKKGNTGQIVKSVKFLKNKHPLILDSIIKTIGKTTDEAKDALMTDNNSKLGELMNINQGLLDSLGINTYELSRMIYTARGNGAIGAKITGAGGGGSILALAPKNAEKVFNALKVEDNALIAKITQKGALAKVRE